jgi:hypothetical protein
LYSVSRVWLLSKITFLKSLKLFNLLMRGLHKRCGKKSSWYSCSPVSVQLYGKRLIS